MTWCLKTRSNPCTGLFQENILIQEARQRIWLVDSKVRLLALNINLSVDVH